jgi:hypothetical protein
MSAGTNTTVTTPTLPEEQKQLMAAQTDLFKNYLAPAYAGLIGQGQTVYNQNIGGMTNAGQNLAGIGRQVQQTAGEVGESALRTGVTGLQSLFNPDYERNQISAALAPAQQQYMQNMANQQAQFGGTGNLGSARQALAGQQLAGQNQALQASTAAQIQRDIAQQRAGVGAQLAGIGSSGLGQAIQGAQAGIGASQIPLNAFAQLAGIYQGVPIQAGIPNFGGTQGQTQTGNKFGISI